jgi:hypothetical protein
MTTCGEIALTDVQDDFLAKVHGAHWARRASLPELRRLLWMNVVWRDTVLEWLLPDQFALIVNPDRSPEDYWEEMTGFRADACYDRSDITGAFLDGALPVARERVGDLVVESVAVEEYKGDGRPDDSLYDEGVALGYQWATSRATPSEQQGVWIYHLLVDGAFIDQEIGPELIIRSFLFMIRPDDVSTPYREAWLRLVGENVSDPWDLDLAAGFMDGAHDAFAPAKLHLRRTASHNGHRIDSRSAVEVVSPS